MTFSAFLRAQIGPNWVVARLTDRLRRRYGADVRAISPRRYKALRKAYQREFGDPDDPVRAELYLALRAALSSLPITAPSDLVTRVKLALEAEANV